MIFIIFNYTVQGGSLSVEDLIALTMETGKHGVSGMALLDKANTETYGNPEITKVNIGVSKKRCNQKVCRHGWL